MNAHLDKLAFGLAAGIAAAGFSTGAQAQDDPVTLRIAHLFTGANTSAPLYNRILDEWQAAHPDVTLVREETANDDHRLKLSTDLAADNVADVFYNWAAPADVNKFVEAGVALDFNEYFAVSSELSADDWTQEQRDFVTRDGKIVALPVVGFKCFMIYNTELFEAHGQTPPTDWDELLAVSEVFLDADIVPINIGSKGGKPGHLLYNVVLSQLGGQEASEAVATTFDVTAAPFVEAANVINELIEAEVFPADSVANGDWPGSIALYNNERAAMLYTCPWMLGQINPEVAAVSEPMFFPTLKGAVVEGDTFHVGNINNGWMVNAESFQDPEKQAAIVSLVDTLMGEEAKKGIIELGLFPAWKTGDLSAYDIDPLAERIQVFAATAPNTYTILAAVLPTAGGLTAFLETMDRLFAGEDPEAVMADFQATLTREQL